jgi:hypothetical protein
MGKNSGILKANGSLTGGIGFLKRTVGFPTNLKPWYLLSPQHSLVIQELLLIS